MLRKVSALCHALRARRNAKQGRIRDDDRPTTIERTLMPSKSTNPKSKMFPDDADVLLTERDGRLYETTAIPIRSEDGQGYPIDRLYAVALRAMEKALTGDDGICPLTLRANRSTHSDPAGQPQLIPTSEDERKLGPKFTFPLGRIIYKAGPGQQVERLSLVGEAAYDWTVSNTGIGGGKLSNRDTRAGPAGIRSRQGRPTKGHRTGNAAKRGRRNAPPGRERRS